MAERTSNVLLKALEEPPERTVWVLCAPSDADLLPTIRSRVRTLRLREPDIADVARAHRRSAPASTSRSPSSPRATPSATSAWRSDWRRMPRPAPAATTRCARCSRVRGVGDAVEVAGRIVQAATDDAKALTAERDEAERAEPAAHARHRRGRRRAARRALAAVARSRTTRSAARRAAFATASTACSPISQSMFRDVRHAAVRRATRDLINRELEPELRALAARLDGRAHARRRSTGSPRRDAISSRTPPPPSPSKACS